jgi:hypothetical protein
MTGPFKDHKAAFDIIVEDLKHKNTENERLTRERDEARAELAEAKIELEELDFLRYEGGEESIGREIEKAEARGYERGVKEAAKVARTKGVHPHLNVHAGGPEWYRHGQQIADAILALLEKPTETKQP